MIFLEEKAASHFTEMSSAFKSKAQQFAEQVISDVQSTGGEPVDAAADAAVEPQAPAENSSTGDPQAYRQENRLSEFG